MRKQNYRQAKRSREESRKTRQQQKMERKLSRGATAATPAEFAEPPPEKGMEDVP
jgi:hypothetical protein